ncbi:helix-turn-helix domain-containing protein [Qipengyuania sp.]|uniref:helix-turn-helix domain-containing protein n=1 Tax=Qipengyuania sp. TaxID=2004515 RepID=UPI003735AA7D
MTTLSPSERAIYIKLSFKLRNTSYSAVARQEGLAPTTVAAVARGTVRSERVERIISRIVERSPNELWPERYDDKENAMV